MMNKIVLILFIISMPLVGACDTIGDMSLLKDCYIDSISIKLMQKYVYTPSNRTRDLFEYYNGNIEETVLTDRLIINEVVTRILKCKIDSVLHYYSDEIVFDLKPARMKNGKYVTLGFNSDDIDIRCRLIIYSKDTQLLVWISDQGAMDIGLFRSYEAKPLIDFIRSPGITKD